MPVQMGASLEGRGTGNEKSKLKIGPRHSEQENQSEKMTVEEQRNFLSIATIPVLKFPCQKLQIRREN